MRLMFALIILSMTIVITSTMADALCGAALSGTYSDRVVDTDGDGLYDKLVIDVWVDVEVPGEYSVTANLCDWQGRIVGWSIDHSNLSAGEQKLTLEFDGKIIRRIGLDGPYRLENLTLTRGSASTGIEICQYMPWAYTTAVYDSDEFSACTDASKVVLVSGKGRGELLLRLGIKTTIPVFDGKYSYEIAELKIPPLDTPYEVRSSRRGYAYNIPGIYMPRKPNDFIVTVLGAEDLTVGLRKLQGERSRVWVSSQVRADESGNATMKSDLISPSGTYQVRIFGRARNETTEVELHMTAVKKLLITGPFLLGINTTGFPEGSYSIQVEAINGSFSLDEMALAGIATKISQ